MRTQAIVKQLKDENQDYEWYPSTDEMLTVVSKSITDIYPYHAKFKLLDIGAGNGNALQSIEKKLDESNTVYLYAMEKSQVLIQEMDKRIIVIGTDFHQQTLIDKEVDVIFSNPPYSEFAEWAAKIIKEGQAATLYLILPVRWKNNKEIKETIKLRKAKYKILKTLSFETSEYRKARAKVDIIKIKLGYKNSANTDAFNIWFDTNFKFKAQRVHEADYEFKNRKTKEINALVTGKNKIEQLVKLYNHDIQDLINNYQKLGELDGDLLNELNVNVVSLREALKQKITGSKNIYWRIVFDRLDDITSRLTVDSRKAMFEKLMNTTLIDFTESNIYAILIWTIKHANTYYDVQLTDLYYKLSQTKNIINYKSNKKFIDDTWRYARREVCEKYKLDYRIIYDGYSAFNLDYHGKVKGLKDTALNLISDVFTVANNLGFRQIESPSLREWCPGQTQTFTYVDLMTNEMELFCEIKAYKNGNLHFKFNQRFMRKLNVEAGRLNGWIKSPKEAVKEMELTDGEVKQAYGVNCQFKLKDIKLLTVKGD